MPAQQLSSQGNLGPSGELVRNQWMHWEAVFVGNSSGAADGTVDWWADGVKIGHYCRPAVRCRRWTLGKLDGVRPTADRARQCRPISISGSITSTFQEKQTREIRQARAGRSALVWRSVPGPCTFCRMRNLCVVLILLSARSLAVGAQVTSPDPRVRKPTIDSAMANDWPNLAKYRDANAESARSRAKRESRCLLWKLDHRGLGAFLPDNVPGQAIHRSRHQRADDAADARPLPPGCRRAQAEGRRHPRAARTTSPATPVRRRSR